MREAAGSGPSESTGGGAATLAVRAGYIGYVLIGWNSVLIPSLIRSIERDFQVADAAFGLFYLLYAVMYALSSLTSGMLTERFGRRLLLPGAALLMAVGLTGEVLAPAWSLFIVAAWLVGAGNGVIDSGTNALFLDLFRQARGGALNLLHLFYSVGALAAPFVVGRLVVLHTPWRPILLATAVGAVVFAGLLRAAPMPSGHHARAGTPAQRFDAAEASLLPFLGLAVGISFLVMGEQGVSSWLVKFLSSVSVATATTVLSLYWAGLAVGRLASRWLAERLNYTVFTAGAMALGSATLLAAIIVPVFPLSTALFALTGFFYGPVYPMIIALGGNIYPHRLARLAGSLGAASIVGAITYPPLMGLMAGAIGLRTGMIGAALLGIPATLGIIAAAVTSRHRSTLVALPGRHGE